MKSTDKLAKDLVFIKVSGRWFEKLMRSSMPGETPRRR
jgi:hypothetical protein